MKRQWMIGVSLASMAFIPTGLAAQESSAAAIQQGTGTPPGVALLQSHNSTDFSVTMTEGKPIETRAPELATDKPAFPGQTRAPYHKTVDFKIETITAALKSPWALQFLPDGKMLVTERGLGTLRIVDGSGMISQPIANVPPVFGHGQVGLLDVALDPKFASNHRIFFSYSEPAGNNNSIDVASAILDQAALALTDVKVIFRTKPALSQTLGPNQGGRIAVARDGTLFVIIGDRSRTPPWQVAQDLDTDLGKMVHITPDGMPAPGNPFTKTQGALPEIWSVGHRSEEGLAFAPDGQLWEVEDGPRGGDELNKIEPGKNYGWPIITHGIDYPGELINGGLTEKVGMEQPVYYWDPVMAPSGLAFYNANLFPAWKGSVFVGALRGMMLDRLTLRGGKVVDEEPLLTDLKERIRDVRIGPEGAVYVLTDSGKLMKLTPK